MVWFKPMSLELEQHVMDWLGAIYANKPTMRQPTDEQLRIIASDLIQTLDLRSIEELANIHIGVHLKTEVGSIFFPFSGGAAIFIPNSVIEDKGEVALGHGLYRSNFSVHEDQPDVSEE